VATLAQSRHAVGLSLQSRRAMIHARRVRSSLRSIHCTTVRAGATTDGLDAPENAAKNCDPDTNVIRYVADLTGNVFHGGPEASSSNRLEFFSGKLAIRKIVVRRKCHLVFPVSVLGDHLRNCGLDAASIPCLL